MVYLVSCGLNITLQPVNQIIGVGTNARFIAGASSPTATFQWQENSGGGFVNLSNGGQYSGVTNDTLTINNAVVSQNNTHYRCIVTESGCSDTSNVVMLTVNCVLSITVQPVDQTVNVAADALFIAEASSPTATLQWQENSGSGFVYLSNGGQYSGVTNDTLTISKCCLITK